ncbi:DNA polymerase III subunit beta [bacterium]|nr:DNA polymerase III subunit beta [bacterium]
MRFACEKQAIKVAIDQANNAVGSSANMPILSHICLNAKGDSLELIATDLNVGIVNKLSLDVAEEGSVAVAASSFKRIVESFDLGLIDFELAPHNGSLIISNKSSRYELLTLPSSEFPTPKVPETRFVFSIPGKELKYMLNTVKFATADASSTRTNMQGVLFDIKAGCLNMVSTDGKRMAKISRKLEEEIDDFKVIVPKTAIDKLMGVIVPEDSYRVDVCEKQIYFSNDKVMFNCSLIDATYPDYTRFFESNSDKKCCVVDRQILLKSLKRVSIMAEDKITPDLVVFDFCSDSLDLTSQSAAMGSGHETIAVDNDAEPIVISFNSGYIVDVLNALVSDKIEIEIKGQNSGVVIRPLGSTDYDYICMPLRQR